MVRYTGTITQFDILPQQRLLRAIRRGHHRQVADLLPAMAGTVDEWLLSAIQVAFKNPTPARRLIMITLLEPYWCVEHHSPGARMGTLDLALLEEAFECLPVLHRIGYTLAYPGDDKKVHANSGRGLMAKALGNGLWPHPELLCPDLFTQRDGEQLMGWLAMELFRAKHVDGVSVEGDLNQAHLERLQTLEWPETSVVARAFSQALVNATSDFTEWGRLVTLPGLQQGVDQLMAMEWLDEKSFERAVQTMPSGDLAKAEDRIGSLRQTLAQGRQRLLEIRTQPAVARARMRRL